MALTPEHMQAAHHVCAWLTLERLLIEAHIHQAAMLRAGRFSPLGYLKVLCQLAMLIPLGICTQQGRRIPEEQLPPLGPLLAQLPAHMQAQLEQAIEAERRGEATHECCPASREQVAAEVRRMSGSYTAQQMLEPPQPFGPSGPPFGRSGRPPGEGSEEDWRPSLQ